MSARFNRSLAALPLLLMLMAGAACAKSPAPAKAAPAREATATRLERATFAMGCFWCAETAFEGLPGVQSVISGYTGGPEKNPTYEQVGSHATGHAEAIQVSFDPAVTTYAKMLDVFWHNVDPTQAEGQFCDRGRQYRSAIFYDGRVQLREALASRKAIEASGRLRAPIVTEITAGSKFYPAEEYHQDFYKKDPERYRSYRIGCGRDLRLEQLWGKSAGTAAH